MKKPNLPLIIIIGIVIWGLKDFLLENIWFILALAGVFVIFTQIIPNPKGVKQKIISIKNIKIVKPTLPKAPKINLGSFQLSPLLKDPLIQFWGILSIALFLTILISKAIVS